MKFPRPLRRPISVLTIISFATLTAIGLAPSAVAAPLFANNMCHNNVQNPHLSASHGGIDVTATWFCDVAPVNITMTGELNGTEAGLFLWLCPSSPTKTETWLANHCIIKGANQENISLPTAGKQAFRTSPPIANAAAHGSGFWVACATWQSHGPGGAGAPTTIFGNIVELSG